MQVICLLKVQMPNSSVWLIGRTLSDATTLRKSGSGSNGNERVLYIHQSSKTGASPADSLVSYPWSSLEGALLP